MKKAKYTIPRKKRLLSEDCQQEIFLNSREGKDLVNSINNLTWEAGELDRGFTITKIHKVDNPNLEREFQAKRAEMKDEGRAAKELTETLAFKTELLNAKVKEYCKEGLRCPGANDLLGDSNMGVSLWRCPDLCLKSLSCWQTTWTVFLVVFRVIKGKVKYVTCKKSEETQPMEPTPNFDCHVSKNTTNQSTADAPSLMTKTQYYLYEYNQDGFTVERPRQCLPYAVVHIKKVIQPLIPEIKQLSITSNETSIKEIAETACTTNTTPSHDPTTCSAKQQAILTLDDSNSQMAWRGLIATNNHSLGVVAMHSGHKIGLKMWKSFLDVKSRIPLYNLLKVIPGDIRTAWTNPLTYRDYTFSLCTLKPCGPPDGYNNFIKTLSTRDHSAALVTVNSSTILFLVPSCKLTVELGLSARREPPRMFCIVRRRRQSQQPSIEVRLNAEVTKPSVVVPENLNINAKIEVPHPLHRVNNLLRERATVSRTYRSKSLDSAIATSDVTSPKDEYIFPSGDKRQLLTSTLSFGSKVKSAGFSNSNVSAVSPQNIDPEQDVYTLTRTDCADSVDSPTSHPNAASPKSINRVEDVHQPLRRTGGLGCRSKAIDSLATTYCSPVDNSAVQDMISDVGSAVGNRADTTLAATTKQSYIETVHLKIKDTTDKSVVYSPDNEERSVANPKKDEAGCDDLRIILSDPRNRLEKLIDGSLPNAAHNQLERSSPEKKTIPRTFSSDTRETTSSALDEMDVEDSAGFDCEKKSPSNEASTSPSALSSLFQAMRSKSIPFLEETHTEHLMRIEQNEQTRVSFATALDSHLTEEDKPTNEALDRDVRFSSSYESHRKKLVPCTKKESYTKIQYKSDIEETLNASIESVHEKNRSLDNTPIPNAQAIVKDWDQPRDLHAPPVLREDTLTRDLSTPLFLKRRPSLSERVNEIKKLCRLHVDDEDIDDPLVSCIINTKDAQQSENTPGSSKSDSSTNWSSGLQVVEAMLIEIDFMKIEEEIENYTPDNALEYLDVDVVRETFECEEITFCCKEDQDTSSFGITATETSTANEKSDTIENTSQKMIGLSTVSTLGTESDKRSACGEQSIIEGRGAHVVEEGGKQSKISIVDAQSISVGMNAIKDLSLNTYTQLVDNDSIESAKAVIASTVNTDISNGNDGNSSFKTAAISVMNVSNTLANSNISSLASSSMASNCGVNTSIVDVHASQKSSEVEKDTSPTEKQDEKENKSNNRSDASKRPHPTPITYSYKGPSHHTYHPPPMKIRRLINDNPRPYLHRFEHRPPPPLIRPPFPIRFRPCPAAPFLKREFYPYPRGFHPRFRQPLLPHYRCYGDGEHRL